MLRRPLVLGTVMLTAAALSACGGDSSSSASRAAPTATPSPRSNAFMVEGGTTTLRLDSSTQSLLDFAGVHVSAAGDAKTDGRRLSFPVTGGSLRFSPLRGRIEHGGALRFSAGGRSVEATQLVVKPGQKVLTANVAGRRVPLLALHFSAPRNPPPAGGPIVLPGKATLMGGQAVAVLGDRLDVPVLKAGLPLGTVAVTARRGGSS